MPKRPSFILPVIVFAQFAGTSLWFACNAIIADLQQAFDLSPDALGAVTSSIQFGFIIGTLTFAFLLIADRFSPSLVFLVCAILGALFNLSIFLFAKDLTSILIFRFLTGFCLAGIYPVGMKISADWYEKGLGKALGYLVGALVLGTAFPHFIKYLSGQLNWSAVIISVSILASIGGLAIYLLVPDGPYQRKGTRFDPTAIVKIFKQKAFRSAAIGYFGHMWELYAIWAFFPVILLTYNDYFPEVHLNISLWCFLAIAFGSLGCILGGYASQRMGSSKVAIGMLSISGVCCVLAPFVLQQPLPFLLITFLLIWGFTVVGDSPQFSTLVAQSAPKDFTGSALTIVNCIGFAITILSIELLNRFQGMGVWVYWILLPGPLVGLWAMRYWLRKN